MSFRWVYEKVLADAMDPDSSTGRRPGLVLNIGENDGGIAIQLVPVNERKNIDAIRCAFVNTDEAREIIRALSEAIVEAGTQPDGQPWQPPRARTL